MGLPTGTDRAAAVITHAGAIIPSLAMPQRGWIASNKLDGTPFPTQTTVGMSCVHSQSFQGMQAIFLIQ
jgi:hypothetical protein